MRFHWAERCQIPVGFGGFHVATLGEPFPPPWFPFVLVYDCGSLAGRLASEWATRVGRMVKERLGRVDLAVLSHTDFDHVCGIDALAQSVHIDTLMLPLLELSFREAQAAAHHRRNLSWYRRFILDPVGWAQERGITNVIFIEDAGGAEGPAPEVRGQPPEDRQPTHPVLIPGGTARPAPPGPATIMSSGDPLTVRTIHPDLGWFVIPIVAPPKATVGLATALAAELAGRTPGAIYAGLSMRKKDSLRNRLARVYRRHWSNTNRSSVMLLVVPFESDGGWLCTGDADLTAAEAQQRLRQHGALFARVDAIHVPHHGSPHNLDAAAVGFLRTLAHRPLRWIVSSGKNQWAYPSKVVERVCGRLDGPVQASSQWADIMCF